MKAINYDGEILNILNLIWARLFHALLKPVHLY